MDANVLAAQKWVNTTYAAVPAVGRVTEDGLAGWQTVYALTRALQHELGLTTLADSFGPATLAALSAHGPIGPAERNRNIVAIVQCGGYCKGYDAGGIDGVYGPRAAAMVAALMRDAGLAAKIDGTLPPKVFKALLNLDSYALAAGGSAALRSAQQWLNDRYLGRSAFFVLPCDGRGSRDILRALTFAVQYELGLSDSVANGNFGPTTQSGLRSRPVLRAGSTGPWVQLLSAAMALYPAHDAFTATFDTALADATLAFQRFCGLPPTSAGDFATWASLLISTGDQTREAHAADTSSEVTAARAATLAGAGYTLVGRYLTSVPGSGFDKHLRPGEPATLFAAGLRLFPIFQTYADSAGYFTWAQGNADGQAAHDAAAGHGIPAGSVVYFAVDYDATDAEVGARVVPYFLGVDAGLRGAGRRYQHGVYGARNVCGRVYRESFARWSFVSGITSGWSGNMAYPLPDNWAFDQIATVSVGSGAGAVAIDRCVLRTSADPGVGGEAGASLSAYLDWVDRLEALAVAYGDRSLVLDYLRAGGADGWQQERLAGTVDRGFVSHVDATGPARIRSYRDPVAGVDVDVSLFGSACLAALRQTGLRADLGGWGADLVTLYGGWLRAGGSAAAYCAERLGAGVLAVSADAYLVASAAGSGSLGAALRALERERRVDAFVAGRFGGSAAAVSAAALRVLTSEEDAVVASVRRLMLTGVVPTSAATFCDGFAAALVALAGEETR